MVTSITDLNPFSFFFFFFFKCVFNLITALLQVEEANIPKPRHESLAVYNSVKQLGLVSSIMSQKQYSF